MSLQTSMQSRARQIRNGRLQRIKTVVEREQSIATEGNTDGFLFGAENR